MKTHRGIWRYLVGEPLPNSAFEEERLTNATALAVLSSDALSSVAYATKEIPIVLILAGTGALGLSLPIALGIALLAIVISFAIPTFTSSLAQIGVSFLDWAFAAAVLYTLLPNSVPLSFPGFFGIYLLAREIKHYFFIHY